MADKKKEIVTAPILAGLNGKVMHDPQGLDKYPVLSSLLHPIWKDGNCVRQSGTMRVSLIGGYFIVCVSCPTEQVETRVTLESLVNMIDLVEAAVRDPRATWLPTFAATKKTRQVVIEEVR